MLNTFSHSQRGNGVRIDAKTGKGASAKTLFSGNSLQPPPDVDPKEVDDLLSRELQQMSFQKRSAIQEEIHGVHDAAVVETPEMIESALQKLAQELDGVIPDPKKAAYIQARSMPSSYVTRDDFRLRFLRSELFDVSKAAEKIVGFLELLLEHYGEVALQRPIRLSDLGKDAMDVLRAGQTMQMLPFRDRSGRRILTVVADFGLQYDYDIRVSPYLAVCPSNIHASSTDDRDRPLPGQNIPLHVLCRYR
jgi:hypothetical protein